MTDSFALVTGACGGIGLLFCMQLAGRGYGLVMVSNNAERLACAAKDVKKTYPTVTIHEICIDLTASDAALKLYDLCTDRGLEIEILVNNAGVFFFNDLTVENPAVIERMIALHVTTVTMLCRYFGEVMKKRRRGYILNMSSLAAWIPYPGISVYSATKSYVRRFSKALHYELRDYGVGVTAVCPGAVATDLYNLSERYQNLAVWLGIMKRSDSVVRQALRAMFSCREYIITGTVNRFFLFVLYFVPRSLVCFIKRKAPFYRYGK